MCCSNSYTQECFMWAAAIYYLIDVTGNVKHTVLLTWTESKFNTVHIPCNYITYTVLSTNLLYNAFFVKYYSDMFRCQLLAIFRELTNFSTCVAHASTYVVEILHVWLKVLHKSKTCKLPEVGQELRQKPVGAVSNKWKLCATSWCSF